MGNVVRVECSTPDRPVAVRWTLACVWFGCLISGLSVGPAANAQADPRAPRVSTRVDPCVPIELDQFHRVLAIELGTSVEYSADVTHRGGPTTVWLTCGPGGVELHLEDGLTRKSMTRVIDVARIEVASRSRLLALAVAEFVVASWVELRLATPAALEPPPTAAQSVHGVVARFVGEQLPAPRWQPLADWRFGLSFDALGFSKDVTPIPGAGLQLVNRRQRPLEIMGSLQYGHRDVPVVWRSSELGDVRLTLISALVALRYVAELGAVDLAIGLGGRFGIVQLAGRTAMQGVRSHASPARWGGTAFTVGAAFRASSQLRFMLEFEAGLVLLPVHVWGLDGQALLHIEEAWLGGSLGLGWAY